MFLTRFGAGVLALALVVGVMIPTISSQPIRPVPNFAIQRTLGVETGQQGLNPNEVLLSGGVAQAALDVWLERTGGPRAQARAQAQAFPRIRTLGCSNVFTGEFDNVRVNQDCSFRRQAEEFIAIDPNDPKHLIASQNDSRIGFNHCGIDVSFDGGKHWADMFPPFWDFILKDGHTSDAASDPVVAFDSAGNAYFSCIVFDINSDANALVVTKSNAAFGGTFFHTPFPSPTQQLRTSPLGVVASEGNVPTIFHDKEFMVADLHPTSPKRDRLYMTWTRFRMGCPPGTTGFCESPIFFSQSADGAATWSKIIEISGRSPACVNGNLFDPNLPQDECNRDQGSWPVVGLDGTIFVFFNNRNTAKTTLAQHIMVKCPASADCTKQTNWTAPVKVADDFRSQPVFVGPQPNDPVTGCPLGRQCLPPNGYRMNDFGAGAIDPTTGRLYFAWSDFRNGGPCATSPGGLPIEPCANHNNDVFLVHSDNGGATWSAPKLVSDDDRTKAAQWQAWMTVGPEGNIYVVYYDRQFGCEASGCNDITLAASGDGGKTFRHFRITTSSMPNLTPANNPVQAGFIGDYLSVQANSRGAFIVWADTRPHVGSVPEEDIYFAFFPADEVEKNGNKKKKK